MDERYIEYFRKAKKTSPMVLMRKFHITFDAAQGIWLRGLRMKHDEARALAKEFEEGYL